MVCDYYHCRVRWFTGIDTSLATYLTYSIVHFLNGELSYVSAKLTLYSDNIGINENWKLLKIISKIQLKNILGITWVIYKVSKAFIKGGKKNHVQQCIIQYWVSDMNKMQSNNANYGYKEHPIIRFHHLGTTLLTSENILLSVNIA